MARLNKSDFRDSILELVKSTKAHPTARWVYDNLREEYPSVAIGTVYRNLNILVSEGLIKSIQFDDSTDHFDANTGRHYHFICEKCGAIRDLKIPFDPSLEHLVEEHTEYQIHNHRLDFYGLCEKCKHT